MKIERGNFPRKIAALSVSAFIISSIVLWLSLYFIGSHMDKEAADYSLKSISMRVRSLQEQVKVIAADYNNWDNIYDAVNRGDIQFIRDNYGISAIRGEVFNMCLMYGGPFDHPLAWTEGSSEPKSSFLDAEKLFDIENTARKLNYEQRATFDFFDVVDNNVVMFSASLLLPEFPDKGDALLRRKSAVAIIGKYLTKNNLESIDKELLLSDVTVSFIQNMEVSGQLPLKNASGNAVAFLNWEPPRPGLQLVFKAAPVIAGINFIFFIIGIIITMNVHRAAHNLVEDEAISARMARTDSLTGIANRRCLLEHLGEISQSNSDCFAIMALDLDGLKQINDLIGHEGGDAFIKYFCGGLSTIEDNTTFIARLGGDEFSIVMQADGKEEDIIRKCEQKAEALSQACRDGLNFNGFHFSISVSIGCATKVRSDSVSMVEIMRRADKAMYYSKRHRENGVCFYNESMDSADKVSAEIEKALRFAISHGGEFSVVYQPIVDTCSPDRLVYSEALVRWNSGSLGSISPNQFIPVAEVSGIMLDLGWIILDLILDDLVQHAQLSVSINISPAQLASSSFSKELVERVSSRGVDPRRVRIELTETFAVRDESYVISSLDILRSEGFYISLDDFGIGYSSIGYVKNMPFDSIKIDKSLIANFDPKSQNACIVRAVISLSHAMNKTVVAEGVETQRQIDGLRELDCDFIQGFAIDKPMDIFALCNKYFYQRDEICRGNIFALGH